jgi:hypothetical protein
LRQTRIRDTVLLSGWLFADLLLGLMVIFMVSIPGAPPRVVELLVTPNNLGHSQCKQVSDAWQCTLKLTETAISDGSVSWNASSDIGNSVAFAPAHGVLKPGDSVTITVSSIPCQNGAFIFHSPGTSDVSVSQWACTQLPQRLERTFCRLVLDDQNPDTFSNDQNFAYSVLKPQIDGLAFLHGRKAGIVIASGGIDNFPGDVNRGTKIAHNAYASLQTLGKTEPLFAATSYYGDLFTSLQPAHKIVLDIYLVIRPDSSADTCPGTNPPK